MVYIICLNVEPSYGRLELNRYRYGLLCFEVDSSESTTGYWVLTSLLLSEIISVWGPKSGLTSGSATSVLHALYALLHAQTRRPRTRLPTFCDSSEYLHQFCCYLVNLPTEAVAAVLGIFLCTLADMDAPQLRDEAVRDRIRLAEEFLDPSEEV